MPVAVITGASSGIGKETAKALAALGWRVIAVGRDPARSAAAAAELRAIAVAPFDMLIADLAVLGQAARLARDIAALTDRVDVLVNNAGGVAAAMRVTPEGNEAIFAGNHLGPFLLTQRLLPLLRRAASEALAGRTRVIATSSSGHQVAEIDWDDLQMLGGYVSAKAYCNAKLANIWFTRELARRVAADGIVAHAMHPGVVDSNFTSHGDAAMRSHLGTLDLRPPAEAADTLIWLATDAAPGRSNGLYYFRREAIPCSEAAQDDALAARLWRESEKLVERSGA